MTVYDNEFNIKIRSTVKFIYMKLCELQIEVVTIFLLKTPPLIVAPLFLYNTI